MTTKANPSRKSLKRYLAQLPLNKVVGVGGLTILCAASLVAFAPVAGGLTAATLAASVSGLGLNVLAGVLQQLYQTIYALPSKNKVEQISRLAKALADEIQHKPELRREIGIFLEHQDAFQVAEEVVEGDPARHGWLLVKIYQDVLQYRTDFERIHYALDQITELVERLHPRPYAQEPFIAPPLPSLVIGREDALRELKLRLGIITNGLEGAAKAPTLTIVRGWPGVGKTTLVSTFAYDPDISIAFPDGMLWIALGENPNLFSALTMWGRTLGAGDLVQTRTLEEVVARLRGLLHNKKMLLIIDDVWETEHAIPFQVGGPDCATLITTRIPEVAHTLAQAPEDVYVLPVLTDEKGLELLGTLAPGVVEHYLDSSRELVHDLEGLPLALQVAGRLLRAEAKFGWGITDLLKELSEGAKVLEAQAPSDRVDLVNQTIPTVTVLLQKSTDRLDREARDYFAFLGAFAPKPATFDLNAMALVWQVSDPKPTVRKLVDRGLLEPAVSGRFQMHALLAVHARSMLE